jgi:hypothetical protein
MHFPRTQLVFPQDEEALLRKRKESSDPGARVSAGAGSSDLFLLGEKVIFPDSPPSE